MGTFSYKVLQFIIVASLQFLSCLLIFHIYLEPSSLLVKGVVAVGKTPNILKFPAEK